jgi:hypothetical protein
MDGASGECSVEGMGDLSHAKPAGVPAPCQKLARISRTEGGSESSESIAGIARPVCTKCG